MTKIAAYWAMSSVGGAIPPPPTISVGGATAPPAPPMEPSLHLSNTATHLSIPYIILIEPAYCSQSKSNIL